MELTPRVAILCVCVLVYAILLQFCVEFVMGWVALIFCLSIFFFFISIWVVSILFVPIGVNSYLALSGSFCVCAVSIDAGLQKRRVRGD